MREESQSRLDAFADAETLKCYLMDREQEINMDLLSMRLDLWDAELCADASPTCAQACARAAFRVVPALRGEDK